ncbi:MAG: DUF423 domain-containing protein [Labilithrix sp.]|nr:DUF423 domain-containing protein [Labilithrix sp.]MCW5812866.1 DUF423 domain-containing protein [Labilithrix sp.]
MERLSLVASGVFGFLAVALGAFGAHGLKTRLAPLADGAQRLEWWNTGAHYQAIHALALGLVAYLASRSSSASVSVAAYAFSAGVLLFSGSLYGMTLSGVRALGAVTPLGGLAFLVGWGAVLVTALRLPPAATP